MDSLEKEIEREGSISLTHFMAASNAAYYGKSDVLGKKGDFITAPEISQIFGELIGLWIMASWQEQKGGKLILAEAGGGRGTLLADALRAAKIMPDFLAQAELHLLEQSPIMRNLQKEQLAGFSPHWHNDIEELLKAAQNKPLFIIANEFLDALPIQQYIYTKNNWQERRIGKKEQAFCFVQGKKCTSPLPPHFHKKPKEGDIFETCPQAKAHIEKLSQYITQNGGGGLFIDYGSKKTDYGDSLQAVQSHQYFPLNEKAQIKMGEADLTAHIDFETLSHIAKQNGAKVYGPIEQGYFLTALGIKERTATLCTHADKAQATLLQSGTKRLIGEAEMGTMFKAFALLPPHAPTPQGFF